MNDETNPQDALFELTLAVDTALTKLHGGAVGFALCVFPLDDAHDDVKNDMKKIYMLANADPDLVNSALRILAARLCETEDPHAH